MQMVCKGTMEESVLVTQVPREVEVLSKYRVSV